MKTPYAVITLVAFALIGCATATTSINTDWDRMVDFTAYDSYAYAPSEDDSDNVLLAFLSLEIGERLEEKGFHVDAQNPDLVVYVHTSTSGQLQYAKGQMGYGQNSGWSDAFGWGFSGSGGTFHVTRNVAIGTIIIDLVDKKENLLVWRSIAEKSINSDNADRDRIKRRVDSITKSMFANFPNK